MHRFLYYSFFIFSILFVGAISANAQTATSTFLQATTTSPTTFTGAATPLLFDEIRFDATSYSPGEIVSGFFTNRNIGTTDVPITYRIELYVRDDETGAETSDLPFFYSTIQTGEVVSAGSLQKNRFSIALPARIPEGDIVFAIQTYTSDGEISVYQRTALQVAGSRQYSLLPQSAILTINEEEVFGPADNPQVNKDEGVMLFISVENPTDTAMRLKPVFTYYKGDSEDGELLEEINHTQLFLQPNDFASQTYVLPISGREPGAYTIVVTHVDSVGNSHTAPLTVQYVVGGMKPTIIDVSYIGFDMNTVVDFATTVTYEPVPRNIRLSALEENDEATLTIQATLFNKKGVVVHQSDRQPFDVTSKQSVIIFPNNIASGQYVTEFVLYEDGARIDSREDIITIVGLVGGASTKMFSLQTFFITFWYQIIVGVLLFISVGIFAIVLLYSYRKKSVDVTRKEYVPKKFEVD